MRELIAYVVVTSATTVAVNLFLDHVAPKLREKLVLS